MGEGICCKTDDGWARLVMSGHPFSTRYSQKMSKGKRLHARSCIPRKVEKGEKEMGEGDNK